MHVGNNSMHVRICLEAGISNEVSQKCKFYMELLKMAVALNLGG